MSLYIYLGLITKRGLMPTPEERAGRKMLVLRMICRALMLLGDAHEIFVGRKNRKPQ